MIDIRRSNVFCASERRASGDGLGGTMTPLSFSANAYQPDRSARSDGHRGK
jgi:hypothetical protein